MLRLGFIRPSSSPYAAPLLLVPKKDNTWRVVLDFRRLNLVTKMDRHPLPLIQDIFDQLGGSTIFTTLDLKQGYHQLPVHPDSIEKTAFACHLGLFEWTRMPMGVSCGPPVFQREMQKVMAGRPRSTRPRTAPPLWPHTKTLEVHVRGSASRTSRFCNLGTRHQRKPKQGYCDRGTSPTHECERRA